MSCDRKDAAKDGLPAYSVRSITSTEDVVIQLNSNFFLLKTIRNGEMSQQAQPQLRPVTKIGKNSS